MNCTLAIRVGIRDCALRLVFKNVQQAHEEIGLKYIALLISIAPNRSQVVRSKLILDLQGIPENMIIVSKSPCYMHLQKNNA